MESADVTPATFLTALFGDAVSASRRVVVWSKGHAATWCETIEAAAAATLAAAASRDTYFGCSLQDPALAMDLARASAVQRGDAPPGDLSLIRGGAGSAVVVGGTWVDLDVGTDGHKGKKYPPTVEGALEVLSASVPLRPTAVVSSGGGAQAWWFLREPLELTGEAERAKARRLVHGLQETIRVTMRSRGWDLDATHDLARVLRLPETWNRKLATPRPVKMIRWEPGLRYAGDGDLSEWCSDVPDETDRERAVDEMSGRLALRHDANPPAELLVVLLGNAKFRAVWERRAKGGSDVSPSAWDYSLIQLLMHRGVSEQLVVDFCVAYRRMHKQEAKELRYYVHSIANAREASGRTEAEERLIEHASAVEVEGGVSTSKKAEILADLSARLGVKIARVERYLTDRPTWHLVLEDGRRIEVGEIEAVRDGRRFTNALAETLLLEFEDFTRARWKAVSRLVLALSEDVKFGPESTHGGEAPAQWLGGYLAQHPPTDNVEHAVLERIPLRDKDGCISINLSHFRRWLFMLEREDMTRSKLAATLRRSGWSPRTVMVTVGGQRTSRSLWSPPAGRQESTVKDGVTG